MILLYIGKSNKRFTHNKIYQFMGSPSVVLHILDENRVDEFYDYFNITVYANNNRKISLFNQHIDYFIDNFKIITEQGIKQLERKKKLQRLNK